MPAQIAAMIPIAILAFTVASHVLAFVAQVFADFHKDEPGWLNDVTNVIAKVLAFLNGSKLLG